MKRGLFVVFEGIDGSGKTTQRDLLADYISDLDKHNTILITREAWKDRELKKKLNEDKDAYQDGINYARLFAGDRARHSNKLIRPNLNLGVHVVCDRYILSTCAYQFTQGVELDKLFNLHRNRGIVKPDVIFFVDVDASVALKRIGSRGQKVEVFEQAKFIGELVKNYRELISKYGRFLGRVITINGNQPLTKVHSDIKDAFLPIYREWEVREQ